MNQVSETVEAFLLSPQQRRLWKVSQGQGEAAYASSCVLSVDGPLSAEQVEDALRAAFDRHEILRTGLRRPAGLGVPAQVIAGGCSPRLDVLDLRALPADVRQRRLDERIRQERAAGFVLEEPPLLRATLVRLEEERQALVLVLSAFVADSLSLRNLIAEICRTGAAPDGEPMQYADFSEWQNGFESQEGDEGRSYWRAKGLHLPLKPALPLGPAADSFRPEEVAWRLGEPRAARLEKLAAAHGVALADLLLAAWAAVLRHQASDTGLVIGYLAHGRKFAQLRSALGLYGRYLPLVCTLSGETRFRDLVELVRDTVARDLTWQEHFTWEVIQADASEAPVFPAAFAMEEPEPSLPAAALRFTVDSEQSCIDRFGVELRAARRPGEGLRLAVRYDAGRFAPLSAGALAARVDGLLDRLAAGAGKTIDSLRGAGVLEVHFATVERNDTARPVPPAMGATTLQQRFFEQATRRPDAIALIAGDDRVTYADLAGRAGGVARRLAAWGLRPGDLVGLCAGRSVDAVAGMLGILAAGGAYLYFDPDLPEPRLRYLLGDARPRLVFAEPPAAERLREAGHAVLALAAGEPLPDEPPQAAAGDPDRLAYVVYTSGSTGAPKGVLAPQRGVLNYLDFVADTYRLQSSDVVLQLAALSFDASVRDLIGPLLRGATVVLLSPEQARDPREMVLAIRRHGVNRLLSVVPTLLRALVAAAEREPGGSELRTILTSGERLFGEDCRRARRAFGEAVEIFNQYGPTECTMTSSWRAVPPGSEGGAVPLGWPAWNVRFHLLDERLDPVPAGWPGELYIAGAGLAWGYVGRPDLTAERFVPEVRAASPGSRMYRTGDRARRLPDGDLEFLGRLDDQVKVRGIRVEPGEVEAALGRHPEVSQAVVVGREDGEGGVRLAAYVVPRQEGALRPAEVLAHLRQSLPEALVPSDLVVLSRLPVTRTGKVDRRALPAPETVRPPEEPAAAALLDPLEEIVAQLWAQLLGRDRLGPDDSFFALGGHSLLATQAMARLRDVLDVQVPLQAVFEAPTVAGLAKRIRQALEGGGRSSAYPPPAPVPRDGALPLAHGQLRIWFLDQLRPGSPAWIVPEAVRMRGDLDLPALERSIGLLVRRHEILRTTFPVAGGQPVQRIAPSLALGLPVVDLRGLDEPRREAQARRLIREAVLQPFALASGPLVRVLLVKLGEQDHAALVSLHHMIADGWSVGLFFQEMMDAYEALVSGRPPVLPELPFQYADFAAWQKGWLESEGMREQLAYWQERLAGGAAPLDLPTDRPRSAAESGPPGSVTLELTEELTQALREAGRREGVTLFMTLFAGFCALLHRYTGQTDLRIGNPVSGRNRPELNRLIGYFVNNLVLRVDLAGEPTAAELLRRVRTATLGAYAHQDLPFARLMELLSRGRGSREAAPFQVMFVLQSFPQPKPPGLELTLESMEVRGDEEIERDLALAFEESDGRLHGRLRYRADLFDAARMERLAAHLRQLLEALPAQSDRPIAEVALLTDAEGEEIRAAARPRSATTAPAARAGRPVSRPAAERGSSERWQDLSQRGGKLSATKQQLLRQLLEGRSARPEGAAPPAGSIPRRPADAPVPLSFGQQRLWFLSRLEPASAAYNVPAVLRLRGVLHRPALAAALGEIVRRHEILRTTFEDAAGEEPVQRIAPRLEVGLPIVDLRGLPEARRNAFARQLAMEEARRPFDLARGPLLRVLLIRTAAEEHIAVLAMHHIVSDAWSARLLVGEIVPLYAAFREGRPSPLPELPLQYGDFALWQRRSLTPEVVGEHLAYWRQRLAGAPAVLALPTDRPRPPVQTFRGATEPLRLPPGLEERVAVVAQREAATPFMVLLAALHVLLARWSGQDDVSVGMPVSGRDRVEIEPLIGFFLNTLVIRVEMGGGPELRAVLQRVRDAVLGAQAHQAVPFERLVSELQPERNQSVPPLFQVMCSLQSRSGGGESERLPGLKVARLGVEGTTAKFDLTLSMAEIEAGLVGAVEYSTDLFDRTTVARLAGHYRSVLDGLLRDLEQRAADVALLSAAERQQVMLEWNDTLHPGLPALAHELFEAQARQTPDALALTGGGEGQTYRELDQRANRLAHHLRGRGIGPDSVVALGLERSPLLAVAVLGVLKTGAAYLPLDPGYPAERLRWMLEDAQAALVISQPGIAEALPGSGVPVLLLSTDAGGESVEAPPRAATGDNLAYVIFTSGSTGRPKGVAMRHGALANLIAWQLREPGFGGPARVLQLASLSFDVSFQELFSTWGSGGTLVLIGEDERRDIDRLARILAEERIERLFLPFVALHHLAEHVAGGGILPASLREVVTAGERLQASAHVRRLFERLPGCRLLNQYGPSETHVVTQARLEGAPETWPTLPPIGRPVANTAIHLLDRNLRPVPAGVPGELYIAGANLARGYIGRPELTAQRFVPAPGGGRLYRTGDLARWLPRGEIEFLGRNDQQVKLRGFRVELEEIEARLSAHPGVQAAAVAVREDGAGRRLVAWVVPGAEPVAAGALRDHLRQGLPDYMVPSAFVLLPALPLTPSGKVDRRALLAPETAPEAETPADAPPRGPVEEIVGAVWAEVLGVPRVGPRQSFFELGGHSLIATRVIARVRAALGVEVPLRTLFDAPTLGEFARAVERALRRGPGPQAPPLEPAPRTGDPLPLSFAQERLWFLERLDPGRSTFNIPAAARLRGPLDAAALAAALREVVRRHEALRTTLRAVDGEPVQEVAPETNVPLAVVDLSDLDEPERADRVLLLAQREAGKPFDLERGPLLRALLIRLAPEEHAMVVVVHHIVSDGWSMGILLGEIASHYADLLAGRAPSLPALPIQYADYARWQRGWLQGEVLKAELEHWRSRLEGAPPVLELPADRPRPAVRSGQGAVMPVRWDAALARSLQGLSRREGVTLFMTVLAGLQALLSRYTGETDVLVGSPIAGRGRLETERLIGLFVNTLVLRGNTAGDPELRTLLGRVRETVLEAHAHQDLPFEKLVQELQPERSLSHTPLVQVALVLQNTARAKLRSAELTLEPFGTGSDTAKVDLTLALAESPEGISGSIEYSTDLFDPSTVARLAAHLERLLAGAAESPGSRVSMLPLLGEAELLELRAWNATDRELPGAGLCLHELVLAQAERTPDAVAVRGGGESLSYGELAARVRRSARGLRAHGIEAESRVGVAMERSPDLVVALLAVLQAGAAYVPLDLSYPAARLAFLLEDAGIRLLLTDGGAGALPDHSAVRLSLGDLLAGDGGEEPPRALPDQIAYVLYTSGSTGRPKGVMATHRGVANYLLWAGEAYAAGAVRGAPVHSPIGFDLTVTSLFAPLAAGGAIEMLADAPGVESLTAALRRGSGPDLVKLTPAHLELLGSELPAADLAGLTGVLVIGGEALRAETLTPWRRAAPGLRLINEYGPTETVVGCCVHEVGPDDAWTGPVPIGRPIANLRLHLLDAWSNPVPAGVPGELYIAGAGLARGYLGRPDLTAERFVPDPFGDGERLYRTGDLARSLPAGNLEYLGRVDHQVKLRGFRIELGEIESALGAHPGVREAAAVVRDEGTGDRRLAAFFVAAGEPAPSGDELRRFLAGALPEPMVPAAIVRLESMPLTPSGKVDRRALLGMAGEGEARAGLAPRDLVELRLARLWEELLRLPAVGVCDSFFDLGGHSLLAARLVARIQREFGRELPLAALFRHATVEGLAGLLRRSAAAPRRDALVEIRRGSGERAPFFCVHPIGGNVLCYVALARALEPEQPFYGLQTPDRAGREEPWTIPAMAARYLEAMRTIQPAGPYRLGGWSLGGAVAFEMARQLREAGEEVELAALIDPPSPRRSAGPEEEPLVPFAMDLGALLGLAPGAVREFVSGLESLEEILAALQSAGLSDLLPPDLGLAELEELFDLYRANHRALRAWEPEASPGRFLVLHAGGGAARADEWARLASGGADLQELEGDHYSILQPEGAGVLARHLTEALRRGKGR